MAQAAFHGNVGKVQGLKFDNDGKPRFSFGVGEGHSRFDKQTNQYRDTGTTWRNVTVFGKRAEALAETIQEGAKQQVVVVGREETRDYEKQDGTKGQSFDVIADVVGIIPKAQQPNTQQSGGFGNQQPANNGGWGAPASGQQQSQGGWGNPGSGEPPF